MTSSLTVAFVPVLFGAIGLSLLQLLLFFVSAWMIFLILIQRGKGGGLTAAFGGGGGDSAFGAKAGDAFTKITIVTALVWITLCMVTIAAYNPPDAPENPFAAKNDTENVDNQSGASLNGGMSAGGSEAEAEEGADDAAAADSESDSSSEDTSDTDAAAATDAPVTESTDSTAADADETESSDP